MAEDTKEVEKTQEEKQQEKEAETTKASSEEKKEEEIAPEDLMAMWEEALKEAGVEESKEEKEEKEEKKETVSEPSLPKKETSAKETQPAKFEELSPEKREGTPPELDFILDIPLDISVEIGRTKMFIKDLLKLNQGSIIELEKFAGEPVEIYVNGKLMAKGEVIVVNDKFGVRITEIISAQERVRRLGS